MNYKRLAFAFTLSLLPVTAFAQKIYWNTFSPNHIRRSNLDGSGIENLVEENAQGLVLAPSVGKMFWAGSEKIRTAQLDGSQAQDFLPQNFSSPRVIDFDAATGKLYWSVQVPQNTIARAIQRANWDGSNLETVTTLVASTSLSPIFRIQLDFAAGKAYWVELHYTNPTWSAIHRTDFASGVTETPIVSTTQSATIGEFGLDLAAGKIYYSLNDLIVARGRIRRANLDGTQSELLFSTELNSQLLSFSLDSQNQALYFSQVYFSSPPPSRVALRRASLNGSNVQDVIHTLDGAANSIVVNHSAHILSSNPSACAIDARQPYSINGQNPTGWGGIELTFTASLANAVDEDFQVQVDRLGQNAEIFTPSILSASQTVTLSFGEFPNFIIMSPGELFTIKHLSSGTKVSIGYLPADANNDGLSNSVDILKLINSLNGVVQPPYAIWQTDIDRSNQANAADILRLIDLLNGAGAYEPWLGQSLPTCP